MDQIPIGIDAIGTRTETGSMGAIDLPADRYWAAQTQRSLHHLAIANDHMPVEVCRAYGNVKKAAAQVSAADGRLERVKAVAIIQAADR